MRKWNVALISIFAGLVLMIFNGINPISGFSNEFSAGMGSFASKWWIMFSLGAVFGKVMQDTGISEKIMQYCRHMYKIPFLFCYYNRFSLEFQGRFRDFCFFVNYAQILCQLHYVNYATMALLSCKNSNILTACVRGREEGVLFRCGDFFSGSCVFFFRQQAAQPARLRPGTKCKASLYSGRAPAEGAHVRLQKLPG